MDPDDIDRTVTLASAFMSHNEVHQKDIPALLKNCASAIKSLTDNTQPLHPAENNPHIPAVDPKKSVFPDYIICLDDGRKMKVLKRHLHNLGMTPEQYREKWNLPKNYPLVAPNYAKQRATIAKKQNFGVRPKS